LGQFQELRLPVKMREWQVLLIHIFHVIHRFDSIIQVYRVVCFLRIELELLLLDDSVIGLRVFAVLERAQGVLNVLQPLFRGHLVVL
jgi:hypothetical protein